MSSSVKREPKRLRSSEPDLQVILGSGDDTSTHWCHSQSLALKSKYVDAMLSTPMREQETRTITFPDISPAIWKKMNKFLDDPMAIRKMTVKDVEVIIMFYDKYEFSTGCKLCEDVILDYFKSLWKLEKSHKLDLDTVIDLTVITHQANLTTAFKEGMCYLLRKMNTWEYQEGPPLEGYSRVIFTEKRIKKIFPLMKYCTWTECSSELSRIKDWHLKGSNITVEQAFE